MKPDMKLPGRRRVLFGPATLLALAVAIGVVVSGRLGDRQTGASNAGRTIYEADASGRLQRVDAPTVIQKMPKGLWKPQIAVIWQHAAELRLDRLQEQRIKALDTAWKQEKSGLEEAMRSAVSHAEVDKQEAQSYPSASVSRITANLGDYSEFSHRFNVRRTYYWSEALAVLTPPQIGVLERVTAADRKGSSL